MKLFNKILPALIIIGSIVFSVDANAQCKRFTKNNCLPTLAPYTHSGKLTSAVFNPGETADVELTFNADKEYRLLICSQETIGRVRFKVLDKTRKVLYESKEGEMNPYFDFKAASTQQLIIQISVPPMEKSVQKTNLVPNGCVAILVGFK